MSEYEEICTNSYCTEVFDTEDCRSSDKKKGSMHGPVKIYTKKEIARFVVDRMDGLV